MAGRGDRVVLLPIQAAWQMRPNLEYLNETPTAAAAAREKADKDKNADPEEFFPTQVC